MLKSTCFRQINTEKVQVDLDPSLAPPRPPPDSGAIGAPVSAFSDEDSSSRRQQI